MLRLVPQKRMGRPLCERTNRPSFTCTYPSAPAGPLGLASRAGAVPSAGPSYGMGNGNPSNPTSWAEATEATSAAAASTLRQNAAMWCMISTS